MYKHMYTYIYESICLSDQTGSAGAWASDEQWRLGFAFDFMYTLTLQPGCSPLASTFTALLMQSV